MSRRQFLEGMRKEARGRCDSLFDGTPLRTAGEDTPVDETDRPAPNGTVNTSVVEEEDLSNSRLHGADNSHLEHSAYSAIDSPPPNEASIFSDKANNSGIALSYEDDKDTSATSAPPPGERLRSNTIAYPSDATLESANKETGSGTTSAAGVNGSRTVEVVNQVIEETVGEEPPAQVYTARPNRPPLPLYSSNPYSTATTTTTTPHATTTAPATAVTPPAAATSGPADVAPKVDVSTTLELENNNGSERTSGLREESSDVVRLHAERSPSDPRRKESSATRMENDLLELQVALATEKKNNIDAEKRMLALKREVDVLKKENMSLASSMNNVNINSLNSSLNNGKAGPGSAAASSGPVAAGVSARYVEELESRVAKLTRQLEEKKTELEAKDERIRLLEHKLVESVLTHEVSPARTYAEQTATSTSRPASPGLVRINSTHTTDLKTLDHTAPAPAAAPTGASLVHNLKTGSIDRPPSSVRRHNSPEMISPRRRTLPTSQSRASTAGVPDAATRPVTTTPGRSTPLRQHSIQRSGSFTTAASSKARPASARRRDSNASLVSEPSTASVTKRKASSTTPAAAGSATKPSSARRASRKGSTSSLLAAAPKEKEIRRSSTRNSLSPGHPMHLLDGQAAPSLSQQRAMVGTTLPQRPSVASSSYAHVSPARSQSPSMRSGTNARSRPQISYNAKDDTTTMKGTTTTVVFRSRSPQEARAPLLPEETRRTSERGEDHFVSEKFSTTTYRPNRAVDVSRDEL